MHSLYMNYTDWTGENEAIILHTYYGYYATPDKPQTFIYADYFFYEALKRLDGKAGLFE